MRICSKRDLYTKYWFQPEVRRIHEALGNVNESDLIEITLDENRLVDDRLDAIRLLGVLQSRPAVKTLTEILTYGAPKMSWPAAVALGQIASKTATRPLVRIARTTPDEERKERRSTRSVSSAMSARPVCLPKC
jgi:HEAT repeats